VSFSIASGFCQEYYIRMTGLAQVSFLPPRIKMPVGFFYSATKGAEGAARFVPAPSGYVRGCFGCSPMPESDIIIVEMIAGNRSVIRKELRELISFQKSASS